MKEQDQVKLFHLNKTLLDSDIAVLEQKYDIKIQHKQVSEDEDETFYPQFPIAIRRKAKEMGAHYEVFYSLENSIRDLVSETLLAAFGEEWWSEKVPQVVKDNVSKNSQRELDAGMSIRSTEQIDYTTFGELSNIIDANWDAFSDTFNSRKGLISVLGKLNLLRGPIAHCSTLTEDEVVRLKLSLRDWFRLME